MSSSGLFERAPSARVPATALAVIFTLIPEGVVRVLGAVL